MPDQLNNTIYENNLKALTKTNLEFTQWILSLENMQDIDDYYVDSQVARYKNINLHDEHDPCGEGEKLAKYWISQTPEDVPIKIIGFGLGFHIEALLKLAPKNQLIEVGIANITFFRLALLNKDLTHILGDPRIKFVSDLKIDTAFLFPGYLKCHPKAKELKNNLNKNTRKDLLGNSDVLDKTAGMSWHRGEGNVLSFPEDDQFTIENTHVLKEFVKEHIVTGLIPTEPLFNEEAEIITLGSCFATELRYAMEHRQKKLSQLFLPSGLNNSFALRQFIEWIFTGNTSSDAYWYDQHEKGGSKKWTPTTEREQYLNAFKQADGFVFTLGLSEIWRDKQSQGIFWRGVPEDIFDPNKHEFQISSVEENKENLEKIIELIQRQCPYKPIIYTLSPVPLKATFRDISCLSADSVSKSILRVALDLVMQQNHSQVFYWPSFEIIRWLGSHVPFTLFSTQERDYSNTCRHADPKIVETIIDLFIEHFFTHQASTSRNIQNKNLSSSHSQLSRSEIQETTNKKETSEEVQKSNSPAPVIVCGCHGGGTSYVTKLLRHLGVFMGADTTCQIHERKTHESLAYQKENERILSTLAPGCPKGMRTNDSQWWLTYFSSLSNQSTLRKTLDQINLKTIEQKFWRGHQKKSLWGWKDPRNSLSLLFWKQLYKNPKILIVHKKHHPQYNAQSVSGSWFQDKSTEQVRHIFMNPPHLDRINDDYFDFDFENDIKNLDHFNALLSWLGLKTLNSQQHMELLKKTNYEGDLSHLSPKEESIVNLSNDIADKEHSSHAPLKQTNLAQKISNNQLNDGQPSMIKKNESWKNHVTLIITAYQRQWTLNRVLTYYKDSGFRIIVADSSDQEFTDKHLFPQIEFLHHPHMNFYESMNCALKQVTTPYVVFNNDDDFVLIPALKKCTEHMMQNHLCSMIDGQMIRFAEEQQMVNGQKAMAVSYDYSHKQFLHQLDKNFMSVKASERIQYFFDYFLTPHHSLCRTQVFQLALDTVIHNPHLQPIRFFDKILGYCAGLLGNKKVLPVLYAMRSTSRLINGQTYPDYLQRDTRIDSLCECLQQYDPLSELLSRIDDIPIDQAQKITQDIFKTYAQRGEGKCKLGPVPKKPLPHTTSEGANEIRNVLNLIIRSSESTQLVG